MKKVISIFVTMALCLSMVACGGSSGKKVDKDLLGNYIAMTVSSSGITLSGEDVSDFTFELKDDGKAVLDVMGESMDGKWSSDDSTLTLTVDDVDMVGDIEGDTITFEDFLKEQVGSSMEVTFAKEGTDAADPEKYLPEDEKALLGDWVGVSVTDVLSEDASGEISPDAMKATLNGDHTAEISYEDEDMEDVKWSLVSEAVVFSGDFDDDVSIYGEYKDGEFIITYSGKDDYYNFTMENSKSEKKK